MDALPPARDTPFIVEDAVPELAVSERLARRWFAALGRSAFEQLPELVDEDVLYVPKVRAGQVVRGRESFARFAAELSGSFYEAAADLYRPLDSGRIVVEGRVRWMDEDRVIRDDPVVWAMEFRDELLVRFVAVRTLVEAETVLAAPLA